MNPKKNFLILFILLIPVSFACEDIEYLVSYTSKTDNCFDSLQLKIRKTGCEGENCFDEFNEIIYSTNLGEFANIPLKSDVPISNPFTTTKRDGFCNSTDIVYNFIIDLKGETRDCHKEFVLEDEYAKYQTWLEEQETKKTSSTNNQDYENANNIDSSSNTAFEVENVSNSIEEQNIKNIQTPNPQEQIQKDINLTNKEEQKITPILDSNIEYNKTQTKPKIDSLKENSLKNLGIAIIALTFLILLIYYFLGTKTKKKSKK